MGINFRRGWMLAFFCPPFFCLMGGHRRGWFCRALQVLSSVMGTITRLPVL